MDSVISGWWWDDNDRLCAMEPICDGKDSRLKQDSNPGLIIQEQILSFKCRPHFKELPYIEKQTGIHTC